MASGRYSWFVSRVLFPVQERLKGHSTLTALAHLERSQYFSREQIEALQAQRLRRLMERAGTKVPYYKELFAERGIDWRAIETPKDLQTLPFLSKADIRNAGDRLLAQDHGELIVGSTSGSTGETLRFPLGQERVSHDVAGRWRATRWWAVEFGDPEVVIWASPIEATAQDKWRRLRDLAMRSTFIDARDLSEARVREILRTIQQANPAMIYGHTTAMARIAAFALRARMAVDLPRLKVVFVTAARLLDEHREMIGKVFSAPVADSYGGRDAGLVANECPAGAKHISEEDLVVEIVDEFGATVAQGMPGEIVVTHLASGDAPFIRYKTGDRGVLGSTSCACGRRLQQLFAIEGRLNDHLVGPDGRVMHHAAIDNLLRNVRGILNYKVVQEREDFVRVQVVVQHEVLLADIERIETLLKAHLGEGIMIDVEHVTDIRPEATGKHRFVINNVRKVL